MTAREMIARIDKEMESLTNAGKEIDAIYISHRSMLALYAEVSRPSGAVNGERPFAMSSRMTRCSFGSVPVREDPALDDDSIRIEELEKL